MPTLVKPHIIPSYRSSRARSATESAFPGLWHGKVGHWVPALGPTGVTLHNLVGGGRNGTLTSMDPATDWLVDERGYHLDLDGLNDYIDVGGAYLTGVPITLACWVKLNNLDSPKISTIVTVAEVGQARDLVRLVAQNQVEGDRFFAQQYDGTTAGDAFSTTVATSRVGIWTHLIGSFDSDASRTITVDGIDEATDTTVVTALDTQDYTQFGRLDWSGGAIQFLDGKIGEVRIYNRTLTPREKWLIYAIPYADLIPKSRVLAKAPAVVAEGSEELFLRGRLAYSRP